MSGYGNDGRERRGVTVWNRDPVAAIATRYRTCVGDRPGGARVADRDAAVAEAGHLPAEATPHAVRPSMRGFLESRRAGR